MNIPNAFLGGRDAVVGIGRTETNVDEIFSRGLFMGFFGFLLIGFE